MSHAPSEARAVRRELKAGAIDAAAALKRARALDDPAHAAPLLALVAALDDAPAGVREAAIDSCLDRAANVERLGQKAEVWREVLKALSGSSLLAQARFAAVRDIDAMPDGEWTLDVIAAVAPRVEPKERHALLGRALANKGFEAEGGKAVLDAADTAVEQDLVAVIKGFPDPEVQRRVLARLPPEQAGGDAVAAAWAVPDRTRRQEALRALAWDAESMDALQDLVASAKGRPADEAVHLLCACAARADRLGDRHQMESWLRQADGLTGRIEDAKAQKKAQRKVVQAMERAGMRPKVGNGRKDKGADGRKEAPRLRESDLAAADRLPPQDDTPPRSGHVLALVDAYKGGLSVAHLRAAARGAALCLAFGHDLWLVGFPASSPQEIVDAAGRETAIGEEARPLDSLAQADRIRCLALDELDAEKAQLVASTPHPDPQKAVELRTLEGPVVLLVGLGKQGLPDALLEAASGHYELTGRGVSLETATAMGILADRLAQVP